MIKSSGTAKPDDVGDSSKSLPACNYKESLGIRERKLQKVEKGYINWFRGHLLGTLCQALFFSINHFSFTSAGFKEGKIVKERRLKLPNWFYYIRFYYILYLLY